MTKIPLSVGWLSEEGLLEEAAKLLGYFIVPNSATSEGTLALTSGPHTEQCVLLWTDNLTFTAEQLVTLGFERGMVVEPEDLRDVPITLGEHTRPILKGRKRFEVTFRTRDKQLARVTVECNPKDSPRTVFEQECTRYGHQWTYIGSEEIEP